MVRAVEDDHPSRGGEGRLIDEAAHLAGLAHQDLAPLALAPHLDALAAAPGQHRLGGVAPFGEEEIGREAPGGKARAAALLGAQKHTIGKPPCLQGGLNAVFKGFVAPDAAEHHSFSKRSTLVTKMVAPPTVTCSG